MTGIYIGTSPLKSAYVGTTPVKAIYVGTTKVRPTGGGYFSEEAWNEYVNLVNTVGSVQFQDSGRRFRFNGFACYIGNRIAVDSNGSTMRKINLDSLSVISSKSLSIGGKIWYFGDNRILTTKGILDSDLNMVTTFSTQMEQICPGDTGVIWGYDSSGNVYRGDVNGDNVTFTKIGTHSGGGYIGYGHLGAYIPQGGTSGTKTSYINPTTSTITSISDSYNEKSSRPIAGPDGKVYIFLLRNVGWGKLEKVGTTNEGTIGNSLSTSFSSYGWRYGHFLGNIVAGGMKTNNGTGNGYGSNNYFIRTDGTWSLVQSNAWAYDTTIELDKGFIDENGYIYPTTSNGGSGVILKTDKTFTDLNWKNPYLYR